MSAHDENRRMARLRVCTGSAPLLCLVSVSRSLYLYVSGPISVEQQLYHVSNSLNLCFKRFLCYLIMYINLRFKRYISLITYISH